MELGITIQDCELADYQEMKADDTNEKNIARKLLNGIYMDNHQRNKITEGLTSANDEDGADT